MLRAPRELYMQHQDHLLKHLLKDSPDSLISCLSTAWPRHGSLGPAE